MKYIIICLLPIIFGNCANDKRQLIPQQGPLSACEKAIPDYANTPLSNDSKTLFWFTKGTTEQDTSWTILVNEVDDRLVGRYTQLLPSEIVGDRAYSSGKFLAFEGFRFEIDKRDWYKFLDVAGIETYNQIDTTIYRGCPHCPTYMAFYRAKLVVSSKGNYPYLRRLDSLLKSNLIDSFYIRKR